LKGITDQTFFNGNFVEIGVLLSTWSVYSQRMWQDSCFFSHYFSR